MRVRAARRPRARDLLVPARCCAVLDRFPRFEPGSLPWRLRRMRQYGSAAGQYLGTVSG
jgi:hypothetical protein